MSLPDQTPKLPKYPFLLGDAALLGAATFIATRADGPLPAASVVWIVVCVAVAGILGAIPFLADYARKQDEALDERQRGLEALSRTINSAAEQISIAASGLHQLVEMSQRNLKHAEHLPQKLQEKIAEFQAQLDNAREDDREELEKELVELRAAETERIESASERMAKVVAELGLAQAALHADLAAADEAVKRLPALTSAIDQTASAGAAKIAGAHDAGLAAIASKMDELKSSALNRIEAVFAAETAQAVSALTAALSQAPAIPASPAPVVPAAETPAADEPPSETLPPKRARRARREEPVETESVPPPVTNAPIEAEAVATPATNVSPAESAAEHAGAESPTISAPAPEPVSVAETYPASQPAATEPETDSTREPIPTEPAPPVAADTVPEVAPEAEPIPESRPEPKPKRAPKAAAEDLTMDLPADDFSQSAIEDAAGPAERVISSDGATRVLVTAYIGIGNRLFLRGDGPGLNRDKGVPLQFVSIGKWRWETVEATEPVHFRIYKNDEIECAGLGELTVDPGHQAEVAAKF